MNILFISSQFPNLVQPNKGIYSFQLVKEMALIQNLRVISPLPSIPFYNFLGGLKKHKIEKNVSFYCEIDGIPVFYPVYSAIPKMGFLHPLTIYRSLYPLIKRLHNEWRIDAVNCHWIFPDGVAAQKICESLRIPIMLTALGSDLNLYSEFRMRRPFIRKALNGSAKVSVLNKEMYRRCIALELTEEQLVIISNGVDLVKFSIIERRLARERLNLPANARIIIFVGSLVPVKGVETLLRALKVLRKNMEERPLGVYILGAGYLENSLKELAIKLGLDSCTSFIGPIKHSDLSYWYNAADCLCLPSLSEGHPNVVMEALACGVPVVASAVGSIPDFLSDSSGKLANALDYMDLSRKLKDCLNTSYDRKLIRERVSGLSWEYIAGKYISEIQQLIPIPT